MRTKSVCITLAVFLVCLMVGTGALAAPVIKYANVVIVAKSGGEFADLREAMNSITDASATNRYLIKVMPGTYDLGSLYFYAKDYVDIEGAGQENTVLTGSTVGAFYYTGIGTTLRNVMLENNHTGSWTEAVRMKTDSRLDQVTVSRNITGTATSSFTGVMIDGPDAKTVALDNVTIRCADVNTTAENTGIKIAGPHTVEISNAKVFLSGGSSARGIYPYTIGSQGGDLNLTVVNSRVEVKNAGTVVGIAANAGSSKIVNTRVSAEGGSVLTIGMTNNFNTGSDARSTYLMNSEVRGIGTGAKGIHAYGMSDTTRLHISNTLIGGGYTFNGYLPKLVNCFDQDYNSIPNQ